MKLAVVTTVYRLDSHTDVLLARWFEDVPSDRQWGWAGPRSRIAAAYVAQLPDNDLSAGRFATHAVPTFPTIAETLRVGGTSLGVDGVLLIAEHGDYPFNDFGQHLYPRDEMFHAIADVFEADGRAVPVFVDKHLSWDFDRARGMLDRAEALGFEVLSASSIPFCRHDPPLGWEGEPIDEAVAVFPLVDGGKAESYGYHSLEFLQHTLERRPGGAAGVERVMAWRGDAVWEAAQAGAWSGELFEKVCEHAMPDCTVASSASERGASQPTQAFRLDYTDGLRVTHVGMAGWDRFAFSMRRGERMRATVARAGTGRDERYANFAILARVLEDWLAGGPRPYPDRRMLMTCGSLQAAAHALALPPGSPVPTPHLAGLAYTPSPHRSGIDHFPA
ncbi:MAG: hypothetical protein AAGH92_00110 [Planctomycetota bacterium]